jgi:hypothetical protein
MKKQRPGDPPEAASQTLMTKKLELRAWCCAHSCNASPEETEAEKS